MKFTRYFLFCITLIGFTVQSVEPFVTDDDIEAGWKKIQPDKYEVVTRETFIKSNQTLKDFFDMQCKKCNTAENFAACIWSEARNEIAQLAAGVQTEAQQILLDGFAKASIYVIQGACDKSAPATMPFGQRMREQKPRSLRQQIYAWAYSLRSNKSA